MNPRPNATKTTPHLTPANLVGRKFSKNTFRDVVVALVGRCPRSRSLDKYHPQGTLSPEGPAPGRTPPAPGQSRRISAADHSQPADR